MGWDDDEEIGDWMKGNPFDGDDDEHYEEAQDFIERNRDHFMIADLVQDMNFLVSECKENKNKIYTKKDLIVINKRLNLLKESGYFWLTKNLKKRYIYDLNDFIGWLCNFMEQKEIENDE